MLARTEYAQAAIHRVEVVAELFQALLYGYGVAGKFGPLGSQCADDMRFDHTRKYGPPDRIFFGPVLHKYRAFAQIEAGGATSG
jgi:hypothetical protein